MKHIVFPKGAVVVVTFGYEEEYVKTIGSARRLYDYLASIDRHYVITKWEHPKPGDIASYWVEFDSYDTQFRLHVTYPE